LDHLASPKNILGLSVSNTWGQVPEIGVGEALLGRWVAIERSKMDDPPEALDADERAELTRLRREVAELRMDRAFLKKAAAFFATENSNPNGHSR